MRIVSLSPGLSVELTGPQFWDAVSTGAWLAGPAPKRRERWETSGERSLFAATLRSCMEDVFHRAALLALLGYDKAPAAPVTSPHVILVMGGRLPLHTVKPDVCYVSLKCLNWNAASRPGTVAHGMSWGSRFEITNASMGETILRGGRDALVCVMVEDDGERSERNVVIRGNVGNPCRVQPADQLPTAGDRDTAGDVPAASADSGRLGESIGTPQAPLAPPDQGEDALAWLID